MKEGEPVRSVLFSLDLVEINLKTDVASQPETQTTEVRLGSWKEPLYICARATGCRHEATCGHSKPHKRKKACLNQWTNILGIRHPYASRLIGEESILTENQEDLFRPLDSNGDIVQNAAHTFWQRTHYNSVIDADFIARYISPTGRYCNNCVAIPDSRIFVPMAKARLSTAKGKVVCPSVIESCVGRCKHAVPHDKNKFCKDMFPNAEVNLQCRSVNSKKIKRGLLFDTPLHACQI